MESPKASRPVRHFSFVNMLSTSDLTRRRLPRMSIQSPEPGPTLWLTACGHGDEVSGLVIIQDLFKELGSQMKCGAVHALPLMNPLGFETASRHLPLSGEDLNRCFPGREDGTLGQRMAHTIFNEISATGPDLVLDLHNDWIESIPYALLDKAAGSASQGVMEKVLDAARQTGFCIIRDTDDLSTSLSYSLLQQGIPALTIELGTPHMFSDMNLAYGYGGIWNVLEHMGMVDSERNFSYPLPEIYAQQEILSYTDRPYTTHTGVVHFRVKPGMAVKKGQALATIRNVFGKRLETLRAETPALVLGHADQAASHPGFPLVALGVKPSEPNRFVCL